MMKFQAMVYRHRPKPENNHHWWKDCCTAGLKFIKIDFNKKENMLLFVYSEAVESNLVKLGTSHCIF